MAKNDEMTFVLTLILRTKNKSRSKTDVMFSLLKVLDDIFALCRVKNKYVSEIAKQQKIHC